MLIRPVLEYDIEVWGIAVWKDAEALQAQMGRKLGVGATVATDVIRGELGWWTMKARSDLARLRFWAKIIRMKDDRLIKMIQSKKS